MQTFQLANHTIGGRAVVARRGAGGRSSSSSRAPTQALFGAFQKKKAPAAKAPALPTVVPAPSYALPAGLAAIAGAAHFGAHADAAAGVAAVLGAFLAVQASRVRFVFDNEALEVVIGAAAEKSENAFVGGANRWRYDTFVNWEFWWPAFPVLVYFKETQTRPEGQIHFFPVLFDGRALYEVMVERCGRSATSGPK